MNIKGSTKVYGLIGQPVSHSISPQIQNALIKEMGYDSIYVCFDVKPEKLDESVKGLIALGIEGFNITMPYKESVLKYLDSLSKSASYVRAVNTICVKNGKVEGHNTDCDGFIRSVKMSSGLGVSNNKVLMLGAGGAAKAVAVGCLKDGCKKLYVHNRTTKRAQLLKETLPDFADKIEVVDNVSDVLTLSDVVINTTAAGMHPYIDESPVSDNVVFNSNQRVFDIIYSPSETKFLRNAKKYGAFTCNGLPMLFWQAVIAFEIWNDVTMEDERIGKIIKEIKVVR